MSDTLNSRLPLNTPIVRRTTDRWFDRSPYVGFEVPDHEILGYIFIGVKPSAFARFQVVASNQAYMVDIPSELMTKVSHGEVDGVEMRFCDLEHGDVHGGLHTAWYGKLGIRLTFEHSYTGTVKFLWYSAAQYPIALDFPQRI